MDPTYKITINDTQKKDIEELRCQVESQALKEQFLSDVYLSRWLTAKHWDVPVAAAAFIRSMAWRKAFDPEQICETLPIQEKELFDHFTSYWPFASGTTKDGWPVHFVSIGKIDPAGITEKTSQDWRTKFFVHTFETMELRRREAEERVQNEYTKGPIIVIDATDLGWDHFNNVSMAFMREASLLGRDHYPEAAGKLYVVNAPRIFHFMWAALQPTISKDTLDKLTILGSDYLPTLLEIIPLDHIPSTLGGTAAALPLGGPYYNAGDTQQQHVDKFEQATVPRAGVFEVTVDITERSLIVWEFKTEDLDVAFGVFYVADHEGREENLPVKRYDADKELIRDLIEAKKPGKYILCWDNTYSWTKRKFLLYRFNVINSVVKTGTV